MPDECDAMHRDHGPLPAGITIWVLVSRHADGRIQQSFTVDDSDLTVVANLTTDAAIVGYIGLDDAAWAARSPSQQSINRRNAA